MTIWPSAPVRTLAILAVGIAAASAMTACTADNAAPLLPQPAVPRTPVVAAGPTQAPTVTTMVLGEARTPSALVEFPADVEESVQLTFDDPSVAELNGAGEVVARGYGTTRVDARAGDVTVSTLLTVTPPADGTARGVSPLMSRSSSPSAVATISITSGTSLMEVGQSVRFQAVARDFRGNVLPSASIEWMSSLPSVIGVASSGVATSVAPGEVLVVARSGTVARAVRVTSAPVMIRSVRIDPSSVSLTVGESMQLSATPLNLQGQPVTMPSGARCTFSSSVQTVMRSSLDGLLFALSAGAATITASCGDKQAAIQAAVAELPPGTPPEAGTPPGSSPVPPAPPTPPAPGQPNPPAPPAPPPPAPPTGDFPPLPAGTVMPEAPRARVDVSYPTPTRTIRVALNGNLQRAIDTARYGDEILLNPAATYIGDFVLPAKAGTGWIVIRSDVPLANFPQGTRITPARAAGFAKLRGVEPSSTIRTAPGARGYRLALLDLAPNANYATATGVVVFDGNQQSATQIPRDLIVDRSWVHGTATQSLQRGVLLNAINAAVVDSYISDVHWRGVEAQAIAGWNGPGPFLVENNYLEASGVNILWGGADPTNPAFAPSDIVVRRNHLIKPLSWKGVWTAKNLFEIKNAARIVVEENLMENCWADAQVGYAVQLIALTDNDNRVTAASTRALDILFRNNVIRNSRGGINVLARVAYGPNPILPSTPLSRLLVANNLFQNVGTEPGIGTLPLMQLLGDLRNTTLAYNTFSTEGRSFLLLEVEDGMPRMQGLTVVGNVGGHGEYGIFSSRGSGQAAFDSYAPGAVVQANVIAGAPAARYPSGNWYPSAMGGIPFTSPGTGNFEIAAPSTWMYQSRIVGVRQADLATAMAANR